VKIPKWVYDRINEITKLVKGKNKWSVTQRRVLRQFLAEIWLGETDEDGWVICTVRDIRSDYASLLRESDISYLGENIRSTLADFLPTLPDIDFRKGKASKDVDRREANAWQFNPRRPESALGKLNLVDVETGESVCFNKLLKSNGKAPKHVIPLEKRQSELKQRERAFLGKVAQGRMHVSFVKALRRRDPDTHYRAGIRSLNYLYNARIEGEYVTYDHHYRLTFGGRYYDQAFQNLPNELKAKFRSGLLNYDIEACNLACLNYLFRKYTVEYRIKSSIYAKMMKHTGLTRKQCKRLVHTTTYRVGRVTIGINDGLGKAICEWLNGDEKKALKVLRWWDRYVSPLRDSLETLVDRIQCEHRMNCSSPRNYHRYVNETGLIIDLNDKKYLREKKHNQQYARDKGLLAFMICGVEQAYIREVVRLNPERVCMLDHDGLVAHEALVLPDWNGFTMKEKE